jgi:DNA-binding transcriptional LysR family regulator
MIEPAETSELLAFVQTADQRSVSRAARELGVPRATVSRRLARLEEHLGVRLLRRTTRSLVLTDAGEAFYGHAKLALDAVGQAEDSVRVDDTEVRGPLRISVPPMQNAAFHRFLLDFATRHPRVELSVHSSAEYVDLHRGGFHVALRAGMTLEPGLVARKLASAAVLLVASPAYLAAHGEPVEVEDLRHHKCVVGFERGEVPQTHWPLLGGGKVPVRGALATNDLLLLLGAALDGQGIAFLPIQVVAEALETGRLVPVLHQKVGADSTISLVYAEREFMPAAVRAFIDEAAVWASTHLMSDVVQRCTAHGGPARAPTSSDVAKRVAPFKKR